MNVGSEKDHLVVLEVVFDFVFVDKTQQFHLAELQNPCKFGDAV